MSAGRARPGGGRTAVIAAMPEELALLRDAASDVVARRIGPFDLLDGTLEGVLVTLAECGIGKVNAAALAQALLGDGAVRVVVTGVAGAVDPELRVGDVVVSTDAVQHDVDVTKLGYEPGLVPGEGEVARPADRRLLEAALAAATSVAAEAGVRALAGRIASGDQFVADPEHARAIFEGFGAACTEMEGAAVAQICARWGVPFVIVRSVSDTADGSAETDFRAFTPLAAARSLAVVRLILRSLRPASG